MKNVWKRTLSLMLSGVLLLGSVPMGAFATEQSQEPTEQVEVIQPTAETRPAVAVVKDEVALTQNPAVDMSIVVNGGEQITSDKKDDLLGDGKLSYDNTNRILTLKGATVETILLLGNDISEIRLEEGTENTISTSLVTNQCGIKITGKGTLNVGTVEVAGNLEIVDAVVNAVGIEGEKKTLIKVYNTIDVSGAAHLFTADVGNAVGILESTQAGNPTVCIIKGEGYYRDRSDGEFKEITKDSAEQTIRVPAAYFEFVGKGHLSQNYNVKTITEHYRTCADEGCPLYDTVKIDAGTHTEETETEFKEVDKDDHKKVYACCGAEIETKPHELSYSTVGTAIHAKCDICDAEGSITLSANDTEMGSEELDVSYTTAGILADEKPTITYTNAEGGVVTPEALGKYIVTMSYGGQTVTKEIEITKIDISSKAVVTVGGTYTYDGNAQVPALADVTVKLGDTVLSSETDYTVTFSNNVNAGAATVTVKAAEDSDYMGEAAGTFTIQKKQLDPGDVKLGDKLTYNGEEQIQSVVTTAEDSDVTFEVKDNKQTNAGDNYELTVEGTGNYAGEVKMKYSIAKSSDYTDVTLKRQVIGKGSGEFQMPKFTGIGGEAVNGTYTYLWNEEAITAANIPAKVAAMQDGEEAALTYTFEPAANGNYTDEGKTDEEKSSTIEIKKVDLIFGMKKDEDHTFESFTANDLKQPDPTYGDEKVEGKGIVDVSKLLARADGKTSKTPGEGFFVKYAKYVNGNPEETKTDAPNAGSNKFYVYYSGTIGKHTFTDVLVCSADILVKPKQLNEDDVIVPVNDVLNANADGSEIALLKDTNKGQLKDGGSLEYSLTEGGTYTSTVPATAEAGYHEVWYRTNANYTPQIKDRVQILVLPYLTATYGQTLKDIKDQLPDGFTFNETAHPDEDAAVGNAGEQKVTLNYKHPNDTGTLGDDYPILTGAEDEPKATLKVSPKNIVPEITLNTESYDKDGDGYIHYNDCAKSGVFIVKDGETTLKNKTDYQLEIKVTVTGLKATHTVKPVEGGNYTFTPVPKEVKLYNPYHSALTENNFPKDELKETAYDTLEKAETELSKKVKTDDYPESLMKFFKVYMRKQTGQKLADNQWEEYSAEGACPPSGYTYVIPYEDLLKATEDDDFKVAVIYYTAGDAEPTVEVLPDTDVVPDAKGLKITLDREALVCVARKVDTTKEYDIAKSIVLDGTSSSKGSLTFKIGSSTVTKATYGKTIEVTAKANSGYSIEKVTFTAETGEEVKWEKVSEGNYKFTMPASKVTVKLSLKKTTSTSKNPSSGDSSNIYLWVVILTASGAAIGALMAFWFKKRKK